MGNLLREFVNNLKAAEGSALSQGMRYRFSRTTDFHLTVFFNNPFTDLDDNIFLKYNVIGILFTGSWVPPAKEFMTKLEDLYAEINKTEKIFEIVQIPNEKTEQAYKDSMTEKRQWLYLPFNDPFIKNLVEQFNVEFLPTFIIVNRDFFVLSTNGRKDMIDNEGVKAYEKWYKAYRDRKQAVENKQNNETNEKTENKKYKSESEYIAQIEQLENELQLEKYINHQLSSANVDEEVTKLRNELQQKKLTLEHLKKANKKQESALLLLQQQYKKENKKKELNPVRTIKTWPGT